MEGQGYEMNDSNEGNEGNEGQMFGEMDAIESFLNQIFTGMRVSTLNPSLIDNVMDQSFREQKVQQFPASNEFIQSLETVEIKEGDEYSCGICLDDFKAGETVLKLPCKDTPHYFHFKEDLKKDDKELDLEKEELEECDGILPWLKIKNSCPICRCEFPKGGPIVLNDSANDSANASANDSEGVDQSVYRGMNQIVNPFIFPPFMVNPLIHQFQSPVELTEEQRRGLQQGPVPEGDVPEGDVPEGGVPEGDVPEGDVPEGDVPEGDVPLGNNDQGIEPPEVEQGPIEIRPRIVNLSGMIQQSMNTILEEREERMMQEVLYKSFLDSRQDTNESIITEIDDTSDPQ